MFPYSRWWMNTFFQTAKTTRLIPWINRNWRWNFIHQRKYRHSKCFWSMNLLVLRWIPNERWAWVRLKQTLDKGALQPFVIKPCDMFYCAVFQVQKLSYWHRINWIGLKNASLQESRKIMFFSWSVIVKPIKKRTKFGCVFFMLVLSKNTWLTLL